MNDARYSKSAMTLHWLIAALMAFQYGLGEAFEHMPRGKALFDVAQFHKSIGISILLLTVLRLGIRFTKPRPEPLADAAWAGWAAKLVHWGFYFILFAAPLTGWLAVSTARLDIPTLLFSAIPWPDFPFVAGMEAAAKHSLHEWAEDAHGILAKLTLLLFLLHVVGALRHQLLLKEALIERMLPLRRLSPVAGSAVIVALAAGAFALMQLGVTPGIAPSATMPALAPAPKTIAATAKPKDETIQPIQEAKAETEVESEKADPDAIPAGEIPAWNVAPGARLGFSTSYAGSAIDGRFGSFRADIRFNPDALAKSRIRVTIPLTSASSADEERDTSLKGPDFFDVGNHPQAVWTSSSIRHLGGNRYHAGGTLNLRGASRPVPLTFTLDIKGKNARVSGNTALRRLAFGVGQGEFAETGTIPDAVGITFNFRATRR